MIRHQRWKTMCPYDSNKLGEDKKQEGNVEFHTFLALKLPTSPMVVHINNFAQGFMPFGERVCTPASVVTLATRKLGFLGKELTLTPR